MFLLVESVLSKTLGSCQELFLFLRERILFPLPLKIDLAKSILGVKEKEGKMKNFHIQFSKQNGCTPQNIRKPRISSRTFFNNLLQYSPFHQNAPETPLECTKTRNPASCPHPQRKRQEAGFLCQRMGWCPPSPRKCGRRNNGRFLPSVPTSGTNASSYPWGSGS